jgi:hypothetical protein
MSAKLVDMAYTAKERKEEAAEYSGPSSVSEWPWGLQIRLEDEELKKLGLKELPEVGGEFHLQVIAKVTSVSQNQMADGKSDRCVCLQITMLGVELEESAESEKGEKETPKSEARETKSAGKGLLGKY